MNCWQILNLSPTSDERAIRRAYAKLLKTTRPDDDAEAYQRLREAFDEALNLAPYLTEDTAPEWSFNHQDFDHQPENLSDGINQPAMPSEQSAPLITIEQIIEKIQFLYNNGSGKALLKRWHTIEPLLTQLNESDFEQLRRYIGNWLTQPYHLPKKLVNLWCQCFDIRIVREVFTEDDVSDGISEDNPIHPILNECEQLYQTQGSRALVEKWADIRAQFDNTPLHLSEDLSWHCVAFLRKHSIDNPILWGQWAQYFGWHNDYHNAHFLSHEELESLPKKIQIYEISSEFNSNHYPIAQAFARFFASQPSFFKRIAAQLGASFIWTEINRETDDEHQRQMQYYFPRLADFYANAGVLNFLRLLILLVLAFMWGDSLGNHITDDNVIFNTLLAMILMLIFSGFLALAYSVFFGGFVVHLLPNGWLEKYWELKSGRIGGGIFALCVPMMFAVLNMIGVSWDELSTTLIWALIILGFSAYFHFFIHFSYHILRWMGAHFSFIGWVVMLVYVKDHFDSEVMEYALAWWALLWFNANLYLYFRYPQTLRSLLKLSEKPFQTASTMSWLKQPFYFIHAAFWWLMLIPCHTAEAVRRNEYLLLSEISLLSFLLFFSLPQIPYLAFAFYPIVLFVCLLREWVKLMIFKALGVKDYI